MKGCLGREHGVVQCASWQGQVLLLAASCAAEGCFPVLNAAHVCLVHASALCASALLAGCLM
jgi:hypothetical protein